MSSIIKVNNIQDGGGNSILSSNGSGTFTPGSAMATGVLANTPAFSVTMSADQTLSTNTFTKLNLNTEAYDTDSAFDTSTYRFTVPSGKAGKYIFTYAGSTGSLSNSTLGAIMLYKNGSGIDLSFARSYPNSSTGAYPHKTYTLSLSVGDYIEVYGQHTKGSNADFQSEYTFFTGQRLIGV